MKTRIHSLVALRCSLLLAVAAGLAGSAVAAETQTLRLDPGWNLIAFQVVPTNSAPAAVFGSLGTACERAFTYDNTTKTWVSWSRTITNQAGGLSLMPAIATGRAYWVYMNQLIPAWQVAGEAPATTPAITFSSGWNLIGIPTGAGQLTEPVNMQAVLAASGLDYDTVLKWEQSLYAKFTPADGDLDDYTIFDPNRGYWVNVKSGSFSLQPRLLSSIRGDVDNEPFGNYPSYEDLRLSTASTPLGATEQTHIVFRPGEDRQTLAIANAGGGILLWDVTVNTNTPWLRLSATRGVTTIENDVVTLYLDRSHLARGTYTAVLTLRTTAGNRTFTVVANVPGLAGEWRGQAQIATANGRHNPLPEIDLHLDFFEDAAIPGLVRGMIDSQNALLWPVDVPLVGHVGGGNGNGFRLSGGFVLPPGDVNNAPFNAFDGLTDIDWNCNGKMDAINPYPFPIYRAVTLNGELTRGSGFDGYEIVGDYGETIYGMLREPIYLTGTFTIRRANALPFTDRRPSANHEPATGTLPVLLKTFNPPLPLTLTTGRTTNSFASVTDLALNDVAVDLDIADAPGSALRLSLVAPDGVSVLLHDRVNLASMRSLSFPGARLPQEGFAKFMTNSVATRGAWKLVVENFGVTPGRLFAWSLRLAGQPVFSLAGRVTDANGKPLPAQVFVDGLPFLEVAQADADGFYQFQRLPGLPLNFSASFKGFQANNPAVSGLGAAFTVPSYTGPCMSPAKQTALAKFRPLPLAPFPPVATDGFTTNAGTAGNPYLVTLTPTPGYGMTPELVVSPQFGYAPLEVTLCLLPPPDSDPTNIWRYGDGALAEATTAIVRSHIYGIVNPTGYQARVETTIGGAPVTLGVPVYPLPSPGNTPYALNFFQIFQSAGGALPADVIFSLTGTNDPAGPATRATLLTVQHAYCASFDLDLAPKASVGARFDSDGFDPAQLFNSAFNTHGNFRDEDHNYQIGNGMEPGEWSLAADCGYVISDDQFNPHPRPGQTGDCAEPRFMMLCNLNPLMLPATADEVYAVTSAPILPNTPDPLSTTEASGFAANRALKLVVGPLAPYWTR